ncbi:hypothetical protein R1sor_007177 [Riccia sorocarpa]|uniref:Uncharacterized protein n=1 Tax=Riccia sorocarpa TaxID=122646 RepID=A0ABD3HRF7_9MARC
MGFMRLHLQGQDMYHIVIMVLIVCPHLSLLRSTRQYWMLPSPLFSNPLQRKHCQKLLLPMLLRMHRLNSRLIP